MRIDRWLSPPAVARMFGVKPDTVTSVWIPSGELRAINVAQPGKSRPRYRISLEAIEDFVRRRTVATSVAPVRKSRRTENVKSFV